MRLRTVVYLFIIIIAVILLYEGLGPLLLNPQDALGLCYFFCVKGLRNIVCLKINIIIQIVYDYTLRLFKSSQRHYVTPPRKENAYLPFARPYSC